MLPDKNEYSETVKKTAPPSPKLKDFLWAFFVGGTICTLAQALRVIFLSAGLKEETVRSAVPMTLIFIAAWLTGLKLFDKIAKHAGAGTLVPITGFANSVVSPAIEFKSEGYILGTGVKMFTIAGPVIVYGTVSGVIYGFIYYLVSRL